MARIICVVSDTEPGGGLANAAVVSPRWLDWRRRIDIGAYDARFASVAGSGANVHGEADLIESFSPTTILDAGCGTGRIAIELSRRGFDVTGVDLDADMIAAARAKAPDIAWSVEDLARMWLLRRFDLIAMPGNVMIFCQPMDRRSIVHNMARHLVPGGVLIAGFTLETGGYTLGEWDEHCVRSGFTLAERYSTWDRRPFGEPAEYHVSVHRRSGAPTVR